MRQAGKREIAFTKVALPFGWLSNMAPYAVLFEDERYRTNEALFQALRFEDRAIRTLIRAEKSPMAAKMCAKRFADKMVIAPQASQDIENMRTVLRLKLHFHPQLQTALLSTDDALIIEDCSKRQRGSGLFWGAARSEGGWKGQNTLGRLWMELRAQNGGASGEWASD